MDNFYSAWEVRTPYTDEETFAEAKRRIISHATMIGVDLRWRKSKGQRGYGKRFHFWEVPTEAEAALLVIACGDKVSAKTYKGRKDECS